ncbi:MAG: hypothetical protein FJY92_04765 [Candidatus Hydrogenedentes bacterium]|nr:hypothetical protein [Candidatus Hydrogenedentota bacterium]
MQFIYVLRPARPELVSHHPTKKEEAIIEEHVRYLKELEHRGIVLLAGRTTNEDERTFGVCVFEAPSEPVARDIMNKDPAVWQGIMNAELFPFRVTMMAENLARV